ncbi:hypothetical protein QQ045_005046 [Rhodiola kirilowii]
MEKTTTLRVFKQTWRHCTLTQADHTKVKAMLQKIEESLKPMQKEHTEVLIDSDDETIGECEQHFEVSLGNI